MGYLLSMRLQLSGRVIAVVALLGATSVPAVVGDLPYYPQGYREWTMTRFRLQGPEHPNYEKQGGFRHYYANDIAHVAVMQKDRKHHPDTGGWYFNLFIAGDTTAGLSPEQARTRCFDACHGTQEARDFVFSDPRR